MPAFAKDYRTVAFDIPGFGSSTPSSDFDYSGHDYAQFLQTMLTELSISNVHLVLHDIGGSWGLQWAASHPEALKSVTLINTGVLLDYQWHFLARLWKMPILGELAMVLTTQLGFSWLIKRDNPKLPNQYIDRLYNDLDSTTKRTLLKCYRSCNQPLPDGKAIIEALSAIPIPALVIWGKQDPYIPYHYAHEQNQVFPNAQITLLEDNSHVPFAEDPDTVIERMKAFFDSQPGNSKLNANPIPT